MTLAINAFTAPASGYLAAAQATDATCAVQLIDRRTGRPHRVGGAALTIYTKTPEKTAAELLEGRDPAVWEARIEHLTTKEHDR